MGQKKKLVYVPIKIHILKYIKVHQLWTNNGELNMKRSFFPIATRNTDRINQYFQDLNKKKIVPALMYPSSKMHQYAMVQYFEELFKKEMFAFIDVREGVFKPLREFYGRYSIYPSDYDFDTAFKRYQRELERRKTNKIYHEQHQ